MAIKGGTLAGKARLLIEEERGEKVVSATNFLNLEDSNTPLKELNDNKTE